MEAESVLLIPMVVEAMVKMMGVTRGEKTK